LIGWTAEWDGTMADNSLLILAVADLAYSGGDFAELLKLILRRNLQIDL
jgi:hypothetical protein